MPHTTFFGNEHTHPSENRNTLFPYNEQKELIFEILEAIERSSNNYEPLPWHIDSEDCNPYDECFPNHKSTTNDENDMRDIFGANCSGPPSEMISNCLKKNPIRLEKNEKRERVVIPLPTTPPTVHLTVSPVPHKEEQSPKKNRSYRIALAKGTPAEREIKKREANRRKKEAAKRSKLSNILNNAFVHHEERRKRHRSNNNSNKRGFKVAKTEKKTSCPQNDLINFPYI
ncbi:unnamed protein product [Lepeophtheirus salmonis]|uniref:(salmon louse) hypothetical protein n=1 Tax=Lepeophtheirus salmonis TaxID=72036 RepID=A0A7R8H0A4_LEPSM|nr:unnamed protein product [Lepeophtheirus salmonis]CAF2780416.1 unnamed protein product [Lepeophtheirus salmonis]